MDGEQLLGRVKELAPSSEMIIMTAHGNTDTAVRCLRLGAADYLTKPFDLDDLSFRIERLLEIQAIKNRCISLENSGPGRQPLIGSSAPMQQLLKLIGQVSRSDATVLIQGESGTGKELVAAAIHYEGHRAAKPYIRVNCAAIPSGLLESELFGHEKGAFTGADRQSIGKFELADQGTILLDEIGDMPIDLQVKLLRVLQEQEIERIGGKTPLRVNVRVLCATARDLASEVKSGKFREDLYYRLKVIPLLVPPLRERNGDVRELTSYFLSRFSRQRGFDLQLSEEAISALQNYQFPGNVRELSNILERLSVLAHSPYIQLWDLPVEVRGQRAEDCCERVTTLAEAVCAAEKRCIQCALAQTAGNKTEAAALLGISRKNLWEKMKQHQL